MAKLISILLFVFGLSSLAFGELPGLMAYWDFNEGKGDILRDQSGRGIDGKIEGAEWVKDGKYGGALKFDGHGVVNFGNVLNMGIESFSFEGWVKQETPERFTEKDTKGKDRPCATGGFLFYKFKSRYCGYGTFGWNRTCFTLNDENGGIGYKEIIKTLPVNEWAHVAIVVDREKGELRSYINGNPSCKPIDISSVEESIDNPKDFKLGHAYFGGVWYYTKGLLDDIAVFGRALRPEEIKKHYEMNKPISDLIK